MNRVQYVCVSVTGISQMIHISSSIMTKPDAAAGTAMQWQPSMMKADANCWASVL